MLQESWSHFLGFMGIHICPLYDLYIVKGCPDGITADVLWNSLSSVVCSLQVPECVVETFDGVFLVLQRLMAVFSCLLC